MLLCVAAGLLYSFFLYYKNDKHKDISRLLTVFLFVLRFVLISCLAFFLLGPLIKNTITEQEKPLIIIAQDNSSSLVYSKDSAYIKKEYVEQLKQLSASLGEKYEVKLYNFDDAVRQSAEITFKGKESDYSALFNEIENNYSNRNLGAVILAGDGLYNKGNNPVYLTSKIKCPVYTIALGDTTPVKDVLIKKIDHNQVAYLGNKFPAEITLDIHKLKAYSGTLTINKEGKKVAEQKVSSNTDNSTQTFSFIFEADKPGVQKYTATISYAEGEKNKLNNTQSFVIDVIDNREKILILFAAPHPDVAAIKESIENNQNYEVEAGLAGSFNTSVKPYSLVILHQVSLSANSRIMNELNSNSSSYFLINPVDNDKLPGVTVSNSGSRYVDAEAVYNKGFSLFTLSDEIKNYFKNYPALKSPLGNYSVSNSVNVMLNQRIGVVETENPLLLFNTVNAQKSAFFIGEGIWKWKLRDYADHENHVYFNELLNKIIQYLSVKADKSFFRVFAKKILKENEVLEIDAEVYNNSYELITDPEVAMTILNKEGKKFNYTFSKNGKAYRLNAGIYPPGEYTYEAQVKSGDKIYQQKGLFTVKELVAEQVNTVADHQLLYQLAKRTGGEMLYPASMQKLQQLLENKQDLKTITYTHKKLSDLIDIKWIFYLLMGILSLEWFMRKRNGLY